MNESIPQNRDMGLWAALFTVFLCSIFGANAVAIKISMTGLGVFTTAGLRFSMGAMAIAIWAVTTGRSFKVKKGQVRQLLILSVNFTAQLGMFYLGLSKTNASRGTLLINLLPFSILFLAHFFIPNDRITKRKFLGIMMGFTGVFFVFMEKEGVTGDFQIGDMMVLTATIIWACNMVYIKRIIEDFEPFQIVFYQMVFAVPFFFLGAVLWDGTMFFNLNYKVLGALFYQGLVTAAFGFVAWNTLLQKYGAVSLHSFVFIMPVSGVLLGGMVLGEPITLKILLSLFFITSGILIIHVRPKKLFPFFHLGRGY